MTNNNTSGWSDNLKSRQIVREHLPVTSYSGFPIRFLLIKLPYELLHEYISLSTWTHGEIQFTTSAYIVYGFLALKDVYSS